MGYFIVNLFLLSGTREIFAKLLDKNEYELYFLIGSTNVKKQIYTMSNGKVKDDSVTFEYEKSLKTELEEFDDLGKVQNKKVPITTICGNIDVSDRCTRLFMFLTTLRCW